MFPGGRTHMTRGRFSLSAVGTASSFLLLTALGCSSPGGPGSQSRWSTGSTSGSQTSGTDAGVDSLASHLVGHCTPPRASEQLPPRVNTMGMAPPVVTPTGDAPKTVIHTSDLFDRFSATCGQCHVQASMGGRQTSAATFASTVDAAWVAAITSDDPAKAMPPENKAYASRPANDPVRQLVL